MCSSYSGTVPIGAVSGMSVAPLDPDSGALGGSFRPAPCRVDAAIAESYGNRRAHPGCHPERSSQGAISLLEWAPRESSPRHRVARRLRVTKRGGSCASEEWTPPPGGLGGGGDGLVKVADFG